MKTLLRNAGCAVAFATLALTATAQDKPAAQPSSAELLAKMQSDKRGLVAKSMELTPEEAKKFWPLYESFERELALPRSANTRATLDYVAAGHALTDANARRLTEQVLAAARDEARLREKHFRQLAKVLPGRKAARYVQIENKLKAVADFESARAIPLVE